MRFYVLTDDDKTDPHFERRRAEWDNSVDLEQITCPVDERHMRAGRRIMPLSIILPNLNIQDFVWTWHSECLLTEKVTKIFHEANFTGYELRAVFITSIKRKKDWDQPIPKLWELVSTGIAHAATSARLYVKERCDACGLMQYSAYEHGLPIDESTWDGSDFVGLKEWGKLIVTQRVKDCIVQHGLTGVSFIQVEDLRWPEDVVKP